MGSRLRLKKNPTCATNVSNFKKQVTTFYSQNIDNTSVSLSQGTDTKTMAFRGRDPITNRLAIKKRRAYLVFSLPY
jgi:hypothetical protein